MVVVGTVGKTCSRVPGDGVICFEVVLGKRGSSWLLTSAAEKLNRSQPRTNSTSSQNESQTNNWAALPANYLSVFVSTQKLLTALDRKDLRTSPLKKANIVQLLAVKHGKFIDQLREVKVCTNWRNYCQFLGITCLDVT